MSGPEIRSLADADLGELRPLLRKTPYKPHRLLSEVPPDDLVSFWIRTLADPASSERSCAFVATDEGAAVGMVACSELPWETAVFSRPIGGVRHLVVDTAAPRARQVLAELLSRALSWARSGGIECLMCKAYTDDTAGIHALEQSGFLLMDTLLDYVYDSRRYPLQEVPRPPLAPGCRIRPAEKKDADELREVARAAFREHMGRFHSDERIRADDATRIYEEWIRSACDGYADWVLIAESEGRIAGYSAWRRPSVLEAALRVRLGHYSIGAVHPDHNGRGLFGNLTYEGMALFRGISDCIEGPTHVNNYAVQSAYQTLGWRVSDARHSFHRWLVP